MPKPPAGYGFDVKRIASIAARTCDGHLWTSRYEWAHLKEKLRVRAPSWLARWEPLVLPQAHPLFHIVPGPVAEWEVTQPGHSSGRAKLIGLEEMSFHRPNSGERQSLDFKVLCDAQTPLAGIKEPVE